MTSHSWHHYQDKNTLLASLFCPLISDFFYFCATIGSRQLTDGKKIIQQSCERNNECLTVCDLISSGLTVGMHKVVSRGMKVLVFE